MDMPEGDKPPDEQDEIISVHDTDSEASVIVVAAPGKGRQGDQRDKRQGWKQPQASVFKAGIAKKFHAACAAPVKVPSSVVLKTTTTTTTECMILSRPKPAPPSNTAGSPPTLQRNHPASATALQHRSIHHSGPPSVSVGTAPAHTAGVNGSTARRKSLPYASLQSQDNHDDEDANRHQPQQDQAAHFYHYFVGDDDDDDLDRKMPATPSTKRPKSVPNGSPHENRSVPRSKVVARVAHRRSVAAQQHHHQQRQQQQQQQQRLYRLGSRTTFLQPRQGLAAPAASNGKVAHRTSPSLDHQVARHEPTDCGNGSLAIPNKVDGRSSKRIRLDGDDDGDPSDSDYSDEETEQQHCLAEGRRSSRRRRRQEVTSPPRGNRARRRGAGASQGGVAMSRPNCGGRSAQHAPQASFPGDAEVWQDPTGFAELEDTELDDEGWQVAGAVPEPEERDRSLANFQQIMQLVEEDTGASLADVERGRYIRQANHNLRAASEQTSAQYGRMLDVATAAAFRLLELDPANGDIFVDLGHGIGETVLQAAYMRQCRARGIEVDQNRFSASLGYASSFIDIVDNPIQNNDGSSYKFSNVDSSQVELRLGGIENPEFTDFLTGCDSQGGPQPIIIKALCNNFAGVFAKTKPSGSLYSLDDIVSGLLGRMTNGSKLLTLHKLPLPIPPHSVVADMRARAGLPHIPNPSFYDYVEVHPEVLDESSGVRRRLQMVESFTWASGFNFDDVQAHLYTKTHAGFVCWGADCPAAQAGERVSASHFVWADRRFAGEKDKQCWVPNTCPCGAKPVMDLRRNRKPRELLDPSLDALRPQQLSRRKKEASASVRRSSSIRDGVRRRRGPTQFEGEDSGSEVSEEESTSAESEEEASESETGAEAEDTDEASEGETSSTEDSVEELEPEVDWDYLQSAPQENLSDRSVSAFCRLWKAIESEIISGEESELVAEAERRLGVNPSLLSEIFSRYGSLLPKAAKSVFDSLNIDPTQDAFVDFGHGYSNLVHHAAFALGCEARGAEVDPDRYKYSLAYQAGFEKLQQIYADRFDEALEIGQVQLTHGGFETPELRDILMEGKIIKGFCNNYGGNFGYQSKTVHHDAGGPLASMLGLMPAGSALVTLHPLSLNAPPQSEIIRERKDKRLPNVENAGYYELEEVELGIEARSLSWANNGNMLIGYKYTRVNDGTFVCWNPLCDAAKTGEPISASTIRTNNECVMGSCSCTARSISLRRRKGRVV